MEGKSILYVGILIAALVLYWTIGKKSSRIQNSILLLASYISYALWDFRFLSIIILLTVISYFSGIRFSGKTEKKKNRPWLIAVLLFHIAILYYFKYHGFFIDSILNQLKGSGFISSGKTLEIIIPLGISVYLLQSVSYILDTYYRRMDPVKDIVQFGAYISFFPVMMAGPINKPSNFIPQIGSPRSFNFEDLKEGSLIFLWGLFKKIVIANNCAIYADEVFANYSDYSGLTILIGLVFFSFQVYADFSGYSDMATGIARTFGIRLDENFRFPYFSMNPLEFWKKWFTSLSSWIRTYIVDPSRTSPVLSGRNLPGTLFLFILFGVWHSGNPTMIIWALINVIFLYVGRIPELLSRKIYNLEKGNTGHVMKLLVFSFITYLFLLLGWVFFRAESVNHAIEIFIRILNNPFETSILELRSLGNSIEVTLTHVIILALYIILEWLQRDSDFGLLFNNIRMKKIYTVHHHWYSIIYDSIFQWNSR